MAIESKICGLSTAAAVRAAVSGGARYVGFVFFPKSPRHVEIAQAAQLAEQAGTGVGKVAVLVDPDDELLARLVAAVPLDLLQLHGSETPRRVAEIRARFGLEVMKAVSVARPEDLDVVDSYAGVVDRFLFDAKAPAGLKDALPGGNAVSFDWRILEGRRWPRPWMLSGGLTLDNLEEAVRISGASAVDVSSGVETAPGVKDPERIRAFLDLARGL